MTDCSGQPTTPVTAREALLARLSAIVAHSATDPALVLPARELHQRAAQVRWLNSFVEGVENERLLDVDDRRSIRWIVEKLRRRGKAIVEAHG